MSGMGELVHKPHHDLKLHPQYDQLLPWVLDPRAWNMHLTSGVVV